MIVFHPFYCGQKAKNTLKITDEKHMLGTSFVHARKRIPSSDVVLLPSRTKGGLVSTNKGVGVVIGVVRVKIENRRRKRSHKLDGIGVGRIRTFPFLPIPFTTPSPVIQ